MHYKRCLLLDALNLVYYHEQIQVPDILEHRYIYNEAVHASERPTRQFNVSGTV